MPAALNMAQICRRIAVERPYFAFNELLVGGRGEILGDVQREHPLGYEYSPLSAAEIGRHLAILGSCAAAATSDDTRLYYLATYAEYQRIGLARPGLAENAQFRGTARIAERTARTLSAKMTVQVGDSAPFVSLFVQYRILSEALFRRLFAHLAVPDDHACIESPYAHPIPLSWSEPNGSAIVARNGGLSPRSCAGHFRDYPAWPVAIIVSCMLRTVEKLLHHILQSPVPWCMDSCTVEAFELIAAGTPVVFSTMYAGSLMMSQHKFICEAHTGNEIGARVVTIIRVVTGASDSIGSMAEIVQEISQDR